MSKFEVVNQKAGRPYGQSDVLTEEETKKLLSLPDRRTKDGLRDYAVLLLLANTPMRKGELVSLNVGNLINEGQHQYVAYKGLKKRGKKPYWLKIPIHEPAYQGILGYVKSEYRRKVSQDEPLIQTLGKHGAYAKCRITPRAIDKIVAKYKKKAGITKRITPHSFRATYLTLRARSHDPMALLKLSGHADLGGITPYLRVTEEQKRAAALSFDFS